MVYSIIESEWKVSSSRLPYNLRFGFVGKVNDRLYIVSGDQENEKYNRSLSINLSSII